AEVSGRPVVGWAQGRRLALIFNGGPGNRGEGTSSVTCSRQAGGSTATVARGLKPNGYVAEETRGRVEAAMQRERVRTRKAPCDAEERVNGEVLQITVLI